MKHGPPEAPKAGEVRNNKDNTNANNETTDIQTKKNCDRRTALEWSEEELLRA